jgi:hypothetical protein
MMENVRRGCGADPPGEPGESQARGRPSKKPTSIDPTDVGHARLRQQTVLGAIVRGQELAV